MSTYDTSTSKQPFKFFEIPLAKFTNEAVPFHKKLFENHKNILHKHVAVPNVTLLERQIRESKRNIQQLRKLMYELDTLRAQVIDSDLDKFDSLTLSLRKDILKIISNYTDLEKLALSVISTEIDKQNHTKEKHCYENPLAGVAQIQLQEDINNIKLDEKQNTLNKVEAIHSDIEDLHDLYNNLNTLVKDQGEQVIQVENNVEEAHVNVASGLKQLIKASKLKMITYPMTGALIGTAIGGPIGLIGGLKVGSIAAIGFGVAGYTGGKIVTKCHQSNFSDSKLHLSNKPLGEIQEIDDGNKKDI